MGVSRNYPTREEAKNFRNTGVEVNEAIARGKGDEMDYNKGLGIDNICGGAASTFLLRLQSRDGCPPQCALFEADGGAWKLEAVESIAKWLEDELPDGITVVR